MMWEMVRKLDMQDSGTTLIDDDFPEQEECQPLPETKNKSRANQLNLLLFIFVPSLVTGCKGNVKSSIVT